MDDSEHPKQTLVDAVNEFMGVTGQYRSKFAPDQCGLYTGLQLEELAEQLTVIAGGCMTSSTRNRLLDLATMLQAVSHDFKQGLHRGNLLRCDHADLIDGQFCLAFVAIAALFSTSIAPYSAITHGTITTLAKFHGGKALTDDNGMIKNPPVWRSPDFEPFVDRSIRE